MVVSVRWIWARLNCQKTKSPRFYMDDNVWIEQLAHRHRGLKPHSDGAYAWCCSQKWGHGSYLIESTLYQRMQLKMVISTVSNFSGVPTTSRIRDERTLSSSYLWLTENAGLPNLERLKPFLYGNRILILPKVEIQKRVSTRRYPIRPIPKV